MDVMPAVVAITVLLLAYANGANDTFKGVATLFGSRTTTYRQALWWAMLTTLAGSLAAVCVSGGLITAFSGTGLVPAAFTGDPTFLLAIGLGAAFTVWLATTVGLPISTTHALTGALVGAGVTAADSVNLTRLTQSFFLPLAISPFVSLAVTGLAYPVFRFARLRLGVERQMCVCVDGGLPQPVRMTPDGTAVLQTTGVRLTVGQLAHCVERYHGRVFGIDAQRILDGLHVLSAGAVSLARGLNDTPKIAALLVAARGLGLNASAGLLAVGLAMGLGGFLHTRAVARTMSERITSMNHGQGFTANLVTASLVLFASRFGLPVSTTHVSCGSLFGLGAVTGGARWAMIRTILLAWVGTLPLAAALAAGLYRLLAS
jgi:PiT family inorganic phosphate transporter